MARKKFIYGIAVVKFNSKEIGYIEKGSWTGAARSLSPSTSMPSRCRTLRC